MAPRNVEKRKTQPKRSIAKAGDDHEVGLWIDYELLRKHQIHTPHTIIHDPISATNNRYLHLADIALRSNKSKKKAKSVNAS